MDNGTRGELLSRLADAVGSVTTAHPTRVAVDGPPAAGKTTLADELAPLYRAASSPRRRPFKSVPSLWNVAKRCVPTTNNDKRQRRSEPLSSL